MAALAGAVPRRRAAGAQVANSLSEFDLEAAAEMAEEVLSGKRCEAILDSGASGNLFNQRGMFTELDESRLTRGRVVQRFW